MDHPTLPEWIETERLRIRAPREEDAEEVREAIRATFETLRPWMPWAQRVPTLGEERARLAESRRKIEAREDFPLFAFERSTGAFVVASGLHRPDWDVPSFETGYWVRAGYEGRGYVTEACRAIAAAAFDALGAARVEIRCHDRNERSWRVAERAGFALEGVLRNERRHVDGTLADTRVYARVRPAASVSAICSSVSPRVSGA
jgi:ribosomal-protein-serine acetyltransferase